MTGPMAQADVDEMKRELALPRHESDLEERDLRRWLNDALADRDHWETEAKRILAFSKEAMRTAQDQVERALAQTERSTALTEQTLGAASHLAAVVELRSGDGETFRHLAHCLSHYTTPAQLDDVLAECEVTWDELMTPRGGR